jgi:hypothetical protein
MEYPIRANGFKAKDKVLELKFGLIVANMSGNGKTIKRMGKEHFIMQMEIFIKDNG